MLASDMNVPVAAKDRGDPLVRAFLAKASKLFKDTFHRLAPVSEAASEMNPRNISGCCRDEHGLIMQLRDADGRSWRFSYSGQKLVAFTDPQACDWLLENGRWRQSGPVRIAEQPLKVSVDQSSAEISIEDAVRTTTYRPDGSTIINVTRMIAGQPCTVSFTEYPTRPARAFVVCEHRQQTACVTWIQDANAQLHKFDWEDGLLMRYVDVSRTPSVVFHAERNQQGRIVAWQGQLKMGSASVGYLQPVLETVDSVGNRHFVTAEGKRFIVGPSGAAVSENLVSGQVSGGKEAIISVSSLNTQVVEPF